MLVSRQQTYDNLDAIANLLDEIDSDIVALQEADAASRWSGKFDHVEYLLSQTGYSCFVHGSHKDSWIAAFGTALLSRVALHESASIPFAPSPPTNTKGFVRSSVYWQAHGRTIPLTVVSVHLDFSRKSVRESQISQLVAELSIVDSPLIILGDFNSEWSDKYSSVRALADALKLDTYLADEPDLGTYKEMAGKRLDWILISQSLDFIDHKVMPHVVSDHLAVYAEVGLREGEQE